MLRERLRQGYNTFYNKNIRYIQYIARRERLAYVFVFVFLSTVLPLFYVSFPLQLDESLFLVIGDALQSGGTLYTGVADHKPPALPWTAEIVAAWFPQPHESARILTYVVNATTAIVVGAIGRRIRSARVGAFASIVYLGSVYLPYFQGYHFQTEPFANLFLALSGLVLLQSGARYRVLCGGSAALAAMFNQAAWLFGAPILVYVIARHAAVGDSSVRETVVAVVTIGLGSLSVVTLVSVVLYLQGSLTEAFLYTVYYPLTGYSRQWALSGQVISFLTYGPIWLLSATEIGVLSYQTWHNRSIDPERTFLVGWLIFLAYPGLTGFSGQDRLIFAFVPAALLAGLTLARMYEAVTPLSTYRSLRGAFSRLSVTESGRIELLFAVLFVGMLVVSGGVVAINYSAMQQESFSSQAESVSDVGNSVDEEMYLLTYKNYVIYHSDTMEPARTFIGYPYSEPLSNGIVEDLQQQHVEYVVVPHRWVRDDGTIQKGGLWADERAPIFEYVNEHYRKSAVFERYAVYRDT